MKAFYFLMHSTFNHGYNLYIPRVLTSHISNAIGLFDMYFFFSFFLSFPFLIYFYNFEFTPFAQGWG